MGFTGFKDFFADPPRVDKRLFLRGIGIREPMPPAWIDRPQGTGDHLVMCFFDQVLIFNPQTGTLREYPPPTLVWWPPGVRQSYLGTKLDWMHSWIHWSGSLPDTRMPQTGLEPGEPVTLVSAEDFERALADLHEEITLRVPWDPEMLVGLSNLLVTRLTRLLRNDPAPVPQELLELRREILLEPHHPWRLAEMGRRCGVSPSRLSQLFKQHFHISPKALVVRCRLAQGLYLLESTSLSVEQIAEQVGYEDMFHFSKLFRKHHGMSPTQARQAVTRTSPGADWEPDKSGVTHH